MPFPAVQAVTDEGKEVDWDGSERNYDLVSKDMVAGAVPEPETYAMLLAGLAAMGFVARRRQAEQTV